MNKVISRSRATVATLTANPMDWASSAIVISCGLALILAGPVLPI
ncbi:MAG: hypothetical protein AAGK17_08135 [Pseudomonadota bacterium]